MNQRGIQSVVKGSLPAVFALGVMTIVPLLGSFFLDANDYAFWALCSSLSSAFIVVDFGAVMLAAKLSSEASLTKKALRACLVMTTVPAMLFALASAVGWPLYQAASDISIGSAQAFTVLAAVGTGTALRSAGSVYATVALGRGRFALRALILIGGAVANALSTFFALLLGANLYSLPIGLAAGGLIQCALGAVVIRADQNGLNDQDVFRLIRQFRRAKSITSICSVVILQADRWALGLVAPASIVGSYDIAARLLGIPRVILSVMAVSLMPLFTSRGDSRSVTARRVRRATMGFGLMSVIGTAVCLVLLLVYLGKIGFEAPLWMALLIAGVSIAASLTLVPTVYLNSLGAPRAELRYLVPLSGLSLAAYFVGALSHDWQLLLVLWFSANILAVAYYLPSSYREASSGRKHRASPRTFPLVRAHKSRSR